MVIISSCIVTLICKISPRMTVILHTGIFPIRGIGSRLSLRSHPIYAYDYSMITINIAHIFQTKQQQTEQHQNCMLYMQLQIILFSVFLSSSISYYLSPQREGPFTVSWLSVNHINSNKITFLKLNIAEIPKAKQSMHDSMFRNERACHLCLKTKY